MLRKVLIYIFGVSLFAMLSTSYILVNHLQASMQVEVSQSRDRIARLKQTVRVHDYLLKINNPRIESGSNAQQVDELNQLLSEENRVLNRNDHRNLRTEVATQLNLQQVPEKTLINSWLTSSMLNDMIELEKNYVPSARNTAPMVVMSDSSWSTLFGLVWLSTIIAAFTGGSIISDLFTKKRLSYI